jgi:hypothetical protein
MIVPSPTRRPGSRGWSVAAIVLLVPMLVSACSPAGTTPSPDPTASAEPAPTTTPGLEWATVDAPGPLPEDVLEANFGAAGRLWTYDPEAPTMLYSTVDAVEWTPLDLTASGLPADARLARGLGDDVVDERGDAATIVYFTGTNGSHPAGLNEQLWLVDVDATGTSATISAGADIGLENLPPAAGALSFRTETIVDFAHFGGARFALGSGQWWEPFKTGRTDAFIAEESGGQWSVFSTEGAAPLGANDYDAAPVALEVVGDRLVMMSEPTGGLYPLDAWVSSDGREWKSSATTFDGAGPAYRLVSIAGDGQRLVAVGYEGESRSGVPVAWSTEDGATWVRTVLPGVEEAAPALVVHGASGWVVLGEADDVVAWTSADGTSWTLSDLEIPTAARSAVAVGDGLAAHFGTGTRVSGLDWAAPE